MTRPQSGEIRKFIVDNVGAHPGDVARLTAERFGITRQAVNRHLSTLVRDGTLEAKGRTRERTYALKSHETVFSLPLAEHRDEDRVWRTHVLPALPPLPENVLKICYYGFAEIFNNAIDHSEGTEALVGVEWTAKDVGFMISDDGVGIFEKIRRQFGYEDHRRAILELSKGKLTTDPEHHTGQGIFYTSRIFDEFIIRADHLTFSHLEDQGDWLIETKPRDKPGTLVSMTLAVDSGKVLKELFDKYADLESGDYDFAKTHVPVSLARYGKETLVSRSQAKRVLARFDDFKEVLLDFDGVDSIGQAFADEIFRVFANQHPEIKLVAVSMSEEVKQMVRRALAARERERGSGSSPGALDGGSP
jgi:hypothetical protein